MTNLERRNLKEDAAAALKSESCQPRKLVLIHAAVSVGLALVIAVLSFVLDRQIAGTGGLAGMGSRAALETVQSLLQMANMVLLPFWQMGLLWVFLSISRRREAGPRDLLAGFHRFGPILRGKLLQVLMLTGFSVLGAYLGLILYALTPASRGFYEAVEPYMAQGVMDYAVMAEDQAVMASLIWAFPFIVAGMLVLTVPVYYRLRLMDYILLDQPEKGAFFAMRESRVAMTGKRMDLFKLDLTFWVFYLLDLLISVICYGDLILPALGVDLGMSADVAYFIFYIGAMLLQVGLYVWQKPKMLTAYAMYYDTVCWPEEPETGEETT